MKSLDSIGRSERGGLSNHSPRCRRRYPGNRHEKNDRNAVFAFVGTGTLGLDIGIVDWNRAVLYEVRT